MAHCVGIEPFTVAMDLEGTDGRERGEVNSILKIFLVFEDKGHNPPVHQHTQTQRSTWEHAGVLIL